MGDLQLNTLGVIFISIGLMMLTFVVVATTAFVKVSVVILLVRNALGIQQVPSNVIIYVFALTITLFIAAPVLNEIFAKATAARLNFNSVDAYTQLLDIVREPVRAFLMRFTTESEREFFLSASGRVWGEGRPADTGLNDLAILIPSFMIAELKRAFEIGFLIYLPFLVIDLVVTTILMAMGMSMMSPVTLSTPIKLFLFVLVDGWSRLVHGLVLSYAN